MGEYIEYVADALLVYLGAPPRYNTVNPVSVRPDEPEGIRAR